MENLDELLVELTCGDDKRAEGAVKGLASLGEAALPRLKALASAPDPDQRWWAVRTLAALKHPEIAFQLREALLDPDEAVRQCAALGLTLHPEPGVVPALVGALQSGDQLLAYLAGNALVTTGAAAVPALMEVLQSGPAAGRLEAARALATIADPRAIPALYQSLNEASAVLEYWANLGLERMGVGMAYFKPD
jgi:HEAT repeat protein